MIGCFSYLHWHPYLNKFKFISQICVGVFQSSPALALPIKNQLGNMASIRIRLGKFTFVIVLKLRIINDTVTKSDKYIRNDLEMKLIFFIKFSIRLWHEAMKWENGRLFFFLDKKIVHELIRNGKSKSYV